MAEHLIDNEGLKNRIKEMIDSMDMKTSSFADKAGISRSVMSNILNNQSNVSIDTINKILSAFPECNKQWLVFGDGDSRCDEQSRDASGNHSIPFQSNGNEIPSSRIEQLISASIAKAICDQEQNTRKISEIKVFYNDGSFETYTLEKK